MHKKPVLHTSFGCFSDNLWLCLSFHVAKNPDVTEASVEHSESEKCNGNIYKEYACASLPRASAQTMRARASYICICECRRGARGTCYVCYRCRIAEKLS